MMYTFTYTCAGCHSTVKVQLATGTPWPALCTRCDPHPHQPEHGGEA